MDNSQKFNGKAKAYQEARPKYAQAFLEYLRAKLGVRKGTSVAEMGSGTGILTRQLLELGAEVFAVEPNSEMRFIAEQLLGSYVGFHSVAASAEESTLPDASQDLVIAAAAFHWFDPVLFKQECRRILKPGYYVCLAWNNRQLSSDLNQAMKTLFENFCPNFKGFAGGLQDDQEKIFEFFGENPLCLRFENNLTYNRQRFIKRALSASYSLREKDAEFTAYELTLHQLFDEHNRDGLIEVPNDTVAYLGQIDY